MNDNSKEKKGSGRVRRWRPKEYRNELIEYTNQALSPTDKKLYDFLFESLKEQNELKEPHELMLLDMAVHEFLRVKRLHRLIGMVGDTVVVRSAAGNEYVKVTEPSYLINAVQSQFRSTMRELLLTRKESLKTKLGAKATDFSSFFGGTADASFKVEKKAKKKAKAVSEPEPEPLSSLPIEEDDERNAE